VTPTLSPRPVATAEDAAALEAELNQLVAAEPILFDKGATTIAAVSAGTLQRVAGLAKRYGGLTIQVQGHTDSEGDAGRNQTLSEQRAEAVRAALAVLGVPGADLTSVGFGESQLITDANGKEIPEQSRRVVFGVNPNS
jgi:OOP family OmpA-OmpF porin